jgi:hypothetical protein
MRPVLAPTWSAAAVGGRGDSAWSMPPRLHAALRHVPPGDRALPDGHWHVTTFLAGLRSSGIVAPLVPDGPMTGATFPAYVEQFLVPVLFPGDVVVPPHAPARVPCRDRMKRLLALHGQPGRPQGGRHSRSRRRCRRQPPLPAASLARPQPMIRQQPDHPRPARDRSSRTGRRAGLRQAQDAPAPGCRPKPRGPLEHHRPPARHLQHY